MSTATPPDPFGRVADGPHAGRDGQVWAELVAALSAEGSGPAGRSVLDCGGGTGRLSVALAQQGADITVVDISADALATLERRAAEAGVGASIHPLQGDVETLGDLLGRRRYDLVLAHGILEALDDLESGFAGIVAAIAPAGRLSVLVANPVATVLARALAGDLAAALAELRALDSVARPDAARVQALCRAHGLALERVRGVGVFAELVPGSALDAAGAADALRALEAEAGERTPFTEIAGRVHVVARRPPLERPAPARGRSGSRDGS